MLFVLCTGNLTQTLTLPPLKVNQYVYIRCVKSAGSLTFSVSSTGSIYLSGPTPNPVSSNTLSTNSGANLWCDGSNWIQI